jgi:hypothetical protein
MTAVIVAGTAADALLLRTELSQPSAAHQTRDLPAPVVPPPAAAAPSG